MSNELSIIGHNLKGRHVVLRESAMADPYMGIEWRIVHAFDGFGCDPTNIGRAVFVTDQSGETYRVNRQDVERFAADHEVDDMRFDRPVVPIDHPVTPLVEGTDAYADALKRRALATCGTCNRSWDDTIPTSMTPTPSTRCPFEYFHREDEGDE